MPSAAGPSPVGERRWSRVRYPAGARGRGGDGGGRRAGRRPGAPPGRSSVFRAPRGSTATRGVVPRVAGGATASAASCRRRAADAAAGWTIAMPPSYGSDTGLSVAGWTVVSATAAAGTHTSVCSIDGYSRPYHRSPIRSQAVGAGAAPFADGRAWTSGNETTTGMSDGRSGEDRPAAMVGRRAGCPPLPRRSTVSTGGAGAGLPRVVDGGGVRRPFLGARRADSAGTEGSRAIWTAMIAPGAACNRFAVHRPRGASRTTRPDFADVTVFGLTQRQLWTGCGCESTAARATRSTPPTGDYVKGFSAPPVPWSSSAVKCGITTPATGAGWSLATQCPVSSPRAFAADLPRSSAGGGPGPHRDDPDPSSDVRWSFCADLLTGDDRLAGGGGGI